MGFELLVHNLSHVDLVIGVSTSSSTSFNSNSSSGELIEDVPQSTDNASSTIVARPKFSEFNCISQLLFTGAEKLSEENTFELTHQIPLCRSGGDSSLNNEVATGCSLRGLSLQCTSDKLRFRSDQTHDNVKDFFVETAYFPLLAVLVPKWLEQNRESISTGHKLKVVLVSGRGKPVDEKAKETDNSTQFTAKLAKLFLKYAYPDIEVDLLHSDTNLFRYDENIVFVKRELLPFVNQYRDKLVEKYRGKWKDNMRVTLSFADGTSARVNAINAALRHFRPAYMHFWVLKSFWREQKIYEDDVECHSFEEVATEPAIYPKEVDDPLVKKVLDEMEKFRQEFFVLSEKQHDLEDFWLRKTKKPVLAVLLVEKEGETKLYRGTNMEVSMPTGSLCAERNVIGSALADDVTLLRENIKIIAVYSVTKKLSGPKSTEKEKESQSNCGCSNEDCIHASLSPKSPAAGHKRKILRLNSVKSATVEDDDKTDSATPAKHLRPRKIPFASPTSHGDLLVLNQEVPATRIVPIMETIKVDESDMNPLKPCGACNEWLKKIAEVNPNLRVVTFTDAQCTGIYIENIAD